MFFFENKKHFQWHRHICAYNFQKVEGNQDFITLTVGFMSFFLAPPKAVHPASRQGSRYRALAAARRAAEKKMTKAGPGELLGSHTSTLPETKIFALKIGLPNRKGSYSNHPFLGAKLVSGRVPSWKLTYNISPSNISHF